MNLESGENANTQKRILLVEDEPHLAFNLQLNLKAEGYFVEHVASGEDALEAHKERGPFDLILLDVMIPEPNGFQVAKHIRSIDQTTAILMLTARAADKDRVAGLELGVDDYICKPFHLKELMLRIKRALARVDLFAEQHLRSNQTEASNLICGPYSLDIEALQLKSPQGLFDLTSLEADVLSEFMRNKGKVLSRDHLLNKVWGLKGSVETRTVDNFVMRLRKYLENDPAQPTVIESVRGRGYRFNVEPSEEC